MKGVTGAVRRTKKEAVPAKKTKLVKVERRKPAPAARTVRRRSALPVSPRLARHEDNPILEPKPESEWESRAVFNPAAIFDGGRVHLAYRAIGDDDRSVLGHAASADGFSFNDRSAEPMYAGRQDFEGAARRPVDRVAPVLYDSGGGGWGGVEDPRLTRLGGRVYMTYTAYDGWHPPRVAMTSISREDFLAGRWNWQRSVPISPPGQIHKNWVIFPEKINGKYAILHCLTPEMQVAYFDRLEDLDGTRFIKSDFCQVERKGGGWDRIIRGSGPPPIKTAYGWLLLYHAMDGREPRQYLLGAMLLDIKDPTKILARAKKPILRPAEFYENEGYKGGVIYACGAVVKDGKLIVYYGGADTRICAASAPLDDFLKRLMAGSTLKLAPESLRGAAKRRGHAHG